MHINRQVILSPAHMVAPYFISRALNGDYIIAGAADVANHRAWATRVSKTGIPIWEYLDGSADGWTDYSKNNQSFYGALDLANGNTLLCGIKRNDKKIVAFLVRIRPNGNVVDERILAPAHEGFPLGIRCSKWGDGVAVIADVAALPRGTGWITKLDASGDVLWEKYGDQFVYLDMMQTEQGGLFLIGGDSVFKLDDGGNVLARHSLPGSDQQFVHSTGASSRVRIGTMLSTVETEILDFDQDLKGPTGTISINNVGIKRCFELADGSLTLFGSHFINQATANVARVYKNGDLTNFTLEPHFQSGWFYDAVASDPGSDEFATVRQLNDTGKGALAWISVK